MKKIVRMVMSVMTAALAATGSGSAREKGSEKLPKVYMFKEISSENLVKIYEALGREAAGKVAVKLSTGEPGNNNYLSPALFGMPAADTLPPILFKSSLLAVAAGLTAARCRRVSLPLLAAVVLGYQAIGTLGEWAMTGSLRAALQDFRIGLPGMSLQILGGWAFMRWILRR